MTSNKCYCSSVSEGCVTRPLFVVDNMQTNLDNNKLSGTVLLDLSTAFNTAEHPIIFSRLRDHIGLWKVFVTGLIHIFVIDVLR